TQLGDQSARSPAGKQPKAGTTVQEGSSCQRPGSTSPKADKWLHWKLPSSARRLQPHKGFGLLSSKPWRGERIQSNSPRCLGKLLPRGFSGKLKCPRVFAARELPEAPRDVQETTAEQLSSNQDAYGPIYESIRYKGIACCRGSLYELSAGTAEGPNMNSGHATAGGEESEPGETLPQRKSQQEQLVAEGSSGDPGESPQEWQELALEEDAVNESLTEREKTLRAMYARVCKKSKSPGHTPPASPDASTEPEEEAPPPLPDKHLDVIYETLGSLGSETQ
ncbi:hypothetical protein G0U57_002300, partial [Chelydra serpentina]